MEQLIEAFGIDVRLITIQIINFVILMALLTYFLYRPILNLLQTREETITQGIKDAEAAADALATAEAEKQDMLTAAHQDAESVAERAKIHAAEKANSIVAAANDKAEHILKDAEHKRIEIAEQAKKESEAEISKLAILAAEKVLRKES